MLKMKTLLKIDSSPMGGHSISRKLTAEFADTWAKAHPGGKIITRDLSKTILLPVDQGWVAAAYTPQPNRTAEQNKILSTSELLIHELEQADEYVFGVPMHNFNVPSTLKLWIDQVVRAGRTFSYGPNGAQGLLKGKKATVLVASGGVYGADSALAALNFASPYLETVLRFIGITDTTTISAEGTAKLQSGQVDLQAFLAPSIEKVQSLAGLQ
jgi:FMN-dependent NADH-azoreductase